MNRQDSRKNSVASTVAEANAQRFEPPRSFDEQWRECARTIDGYAIAEELGRDLMEWGPMNLELVCRGGRTGLSLLELRMVLFYLQRSDYFVGGSSSNEVRADQVFAEMAAVVGQPYRRLRTIVDKFNLLSEFSNVPENHRDRWLSEHEVTPEDLRTWEQEIRDALERYNSWQ